ncbi:MAG: peptidoglycan-binding protein [Halothiobacillaceae bacterium]
MTVNPTQQINSSQTAYKLLCRLSLVSVILATQACSLMPAEPQSEPRVQEPAISKSKPEARIPANSDMKPLTAPTPAAPAAEPRLKAGECWAPTVILPRRISTALEIVTRDAVNDIQVRPATIKPEQRTRIVREGTQTYRVEPPVFKKVTKKILVREEVRRSIVEPATFETREEKIEIEAAHDALVPCRVPGSINTGSGQALCVKAMPARYKTITRKILLKPETTREEVEPAIYREVSTWVVETPARTVPIDLPEKTRSYTVLAISTPEQIDETQQPPTIVNINSTRYDGTPTPVWRQTPCAEDLSPELIQRLQTALNKAGFQVGPVDGKLGDRTSRAVQSYQNQHGLASGALTLETMHHLGVLEADQTKVR